MIRLSPHFKEWYHISSQGYMSCNDHRVYVIHKASSTRLHSLRAAPLTEQDTVDKILKKYEGNL